MDLLLLFLSTLTAVSSQELWVSPCPRLFTYEAKNPNEPDKWYGILTLLTDSDLSGTWLRLILDKPSLQLGNWFGEVKTEDNKDFLIKNRNNKIKANTPSYIRFYIRYDTSQPPPQLAGFRLNAKMVCPEGAATTEAPSTMGQLITSAELTTTPIPGALIPEPIQPGPEPRPRPRPGPAPGSDSGFGRPGGGSFGNSHTDDDDYFQGDFSYLFRPKPQEQNRPALDDSCGTVIKQPRPLITHGQQTGEGDFPWHAALYHSKGIDLTYVCGASLISRYHLITVAHCVTRRKSHASLSPNNLVIYLGKFYLRTWSNPGIQDRNVEKIFIHEKYDATTFSYDIAVLKMTTSAEITAYVRPVCLWDGPPNLESVIGRQGTVVGWGFDETGKVTEILTKANMPIVSQETCIYSFPDFFGRFTSDKTYCAGFKNGTSVCNGDSGGGMVFPKVTNNPNNPIWFLRGMVSISVALQNQFRCDSSHYVVFTDVAKFLGWIKNVMNY